MIIVKIVGGLGNQMFQYAYAKALNSKGYNVKLDISVFETYRLHGGYQLDKYNISLKVASSKETNKLYKNSFLSKIAKRLSIQNGNLLEEKSLLYDERLVNIKDNKYITGYFQNERYFKEIREILLKEFTLKEQSTAYTQEISNVIMATKNSCSLHVRRGDFTNSTNISIHGTCTVEYYQKAIEYMKEYADSVKYFIFSDDIEWTKNNLKIENAVYIDSKEKRLPHEDIYLMSLCNHNIIANSSFSWWGAWSNDNKDKIVVAPKKWFINLKLLDQSRDIIPKSWIQI